MRLKEDRSNWDAIWVDYACVNCKKQDWQIIKRDK